MRVCSSCLFVLLTASAAAQDTANTATVSGDVVSAAARPEPIAGALVTLSGGFPAVRVTTVSGRDGSFVFERLPAGRFTLTISKPAYLTRTYGSQDATDPGTMLSVQAGQHLRGIRAKLPKGAVITGVVTDASATPASNVTVMLFPVRPRPGVAHADPGVRVRTNDLGQYRAFGLEPGRYLVAASVPAVGVGTYARVTSAEVDALLDRLKRGERGAPAESRARTLLPDQHTRLAAVYFPGTSILSNAQDVNVAADEEKSGVDVTLDYVRTQPVEGRVVGATPLTGTRITIEPATPVAEHPERLRVAPVAADADGRFRFDAVNPGTYVVSGRTVSSDRSPGSTNPPWVGFGEVVVGTGPVAGIVIEMRPAVSVRGRVVFKGTLPAPAAAALRQIKVMLVRAEPPANPFLQTSRASVEADGSFLLNDVLPGTYRLAVTLTTRALQQTWWLDSALLGGRDALDAAGPVGSDGRPTDALLVFSDRHTEIRGRLHGPGGEPAVDGVVVLFSADDRHWRPESRRVRAVRPATDGQYTAIGLPPGEYWIAIADSTRVATDSPDFLKSLMPAAVKVSLAAGVTVTRDFEMGR